jgi:ferredoxin
MTSIRELKNTARELLQSGQVRCVIGYESGPRGRTRPAFIYSTEDVERLIWDQSCTHNLSVYLKDALKTAKKGEQDESPRCVALVAKPCDSRAINVLIAENQFEREQVHVIGMMCDGIVETNSNGSNVANYQRRCLHCNLEEPVVYDSLIGERKGSIPTLQGELTDELAHLQAISAGERAEFWLEQFDRCIRCYACRQVCPMCNCPTCLYERDDSVWVGMQIEVNQKRSFHLGRAYHLAGRCVGCNECERVCPMDIPISLLNQVLAKEVETVFGTWAGMDTRPSPLVTVLSGEEHGI